MQAWHLYSGDFDDSVCNNFGVNETINAISAKRYDNWVNNVMTWGAGNSVAEQSVTNRDWVKTVFSLDIPLLLSTFIVARLTIT